MLLAIRDKAQGWFAWAIIIFISIPFALWGIQSYLGVGSESVAAEVDGVEIIERDLERRVRNYRSSLRDRLGAAYNADLFKESVLREQMLDQMVNEVVQQETAISWGLRAGDELIRANIRTNDAFQGASGFDIDTYTTTLRNNGLTQTGFEESVRAELIQRQFVQGIEGSAFLTKTDISAEIRLQQQTRELQYLQINAIDYLDQVSTDEEELKTYYKANAASYRIPERVKLEYLILDLAAVAAQVGVDDAQLRDYYDTHKDEFKVPEERRVRHILINLSAQADADDTAAARAKAQALFVRIQAGEDFATLAAEFSEDPGSASQGGDLGLMSPNMMPEEFETVAFALALNQVGEPVKTPFGYHLIEVTELRAGGAGDFDSLRDEITLAYTTSEAESRFFDLAEQLAEVSYENPDNLLPAAEALEIKIQESDWIDRSGGSGDLNSPKIIAAAFSEDVLDQGNNSELIELEDEKVIVLRSVEHETEQTRPFADVRDLVKEALANEKAAALATAEGERLLKVLADGKRLAEIAAQLGLDLKEPGLIDRTDIVVPSVIAARAFGLPRPEMGETSTAGVGLASGDYALLAVSKVVDGTMDTSNPEALKLAVKGRNQQRGRQEYRQLAVALKKAATVVIPD